MTALVDGVTFQVIAKVPEEVREGDDVPVFPASTVAVTSHGERATSVLDEQPEGGMGQSAIAGSERVTDSGHQLKGARVRGFGGVRGSEDAMAMKGEYDEGIKKMW